MHTKLEIPEQRMCRQCEEWFFAEWTDKYYCSIKCRTKYNNSKKDKQLKCPKCHHIFKSSEGEIKDEG